MYFIEKYSYLSASFLGVLISFLLIFFVLPKGQRRFSIYAGLMGLACCPGLTFFEGLYWSPLRLVKSIPGIEDLFISFFVAVLAWAVGTFPFRRTLKINTRFRIQTKRFLIAGGGAIFLFVLAVKLGIHPMSSLLLTQILIVFFLVVLNPRLWRLAVAGMIGFPVFYLMYAKMIFLLWPGLLLQWNLSHFWGQLVLGIPLGEVAWSVGHGAFWPLFVGFVFDVRLRSKR